MDAALKPRGANRTSAKRLAGLLPPSIAHKIGAAALTSCRGANGPAWQSIAAPPVRRYRAALGAGGGCVGAGPQGPGPPGLFGAVARPTLPAREADGAAVERSRRGAGAGQPAPGPDGAAACTWRAV